MNFERTHDMELVKDIVTRDSIYWRVTDDFAPTPEKWNPLDDESMWYVTAKEEAALLGMFIFTPENSISWAIHLCLLPLAYGSKTRLALREVTEWIFKNSRCLRIVGSVPSYNRAAVKFAKDSGWKAYGVNEKSYLKHGRLWDQHLFGISKDTVCQSLAA